MDTLLLLDVNGPWGVPHAGPGHFPGFFFCGPLLFWTLLLGFVAVRTFSRYSARPVAPHRAAPSPDAPSDSTPWPNLDPAPPTPQASGDSLERKGKVEYF